MQQSVLPVRSRSISSLGRHSRGASTRMGAGIARAKLFGRRLCLAMLLGAPPATLAQSGAGYDLHWNALPSGGGAMSGADGYTLDGAVAPANTATAGGSGYTLRAGFWSGVHENDVVFRNGFQAPP